MADQTLPAGFALDQDPASSSGMPEDGMSLPSGFELDEDKYGSTGQQVATAAEGAAEGVLGPLAPLLEQKVFGINPSDIRARREENPITHGVSQAVGFGGSMLTGVGEGALIARAGSAAVKGLEGANALSKITSGGLRAATEMALLSTSDETSKMIEQDPNQSLGSAAVNVGLSGILGGVGGAAIGSVSPLWKAVNEGPLGKTLNMFKSDISTAETPANDLAIKPSIRKMLSTYGGVSEESIENYLTHHKAIQEIPEFSDIYGHALDHVGKISDDLLEKKISAQEASNMFKEYAQGVKDSVRQKTFDASTSDRDARFILKDAQTKLASDVQQQAFNGSKHIADAVEDLRSKVIDASSSAYETLDKSGAQIPLKPFFDKSMEVAADLESQGTLETKAMANRVRQYVQGVWDQFPGKLEVSGPEAKALIKGLDQNSVYNFSATSFDNNMSRAYKQLRWTLDDTLKTKVPEYASQMKPLAKDTQLLRSLDRYGSQEEAVRAVNQLKNPARYKTEWPMLQELEKKTGIKFLQNIEPYANPEVREQLIKALPEYSAAEKAADALQTLKNPSTQRELESALAESEHFKTLQSAQQQVQEAQAAKESLSGLTPTNLESKLKSAMAGRGIETRKAIGALPPMEGKNLPEILDLLRMKEAFEKNATRGSKNVNLYATSLGGLLGSVFGPVGAGAGAAIGGVLGASADVSGPQAVRTLLDKYASHFGTAAQMTGEKNGIQHAILGLLRAQGPADAEAFKAASAYASTINKGANAITKAANSLFKAGAEVIPTSLMPNELSREKLEKQLGQIEQDPNKAMGIGGKIGVYMPNHGSQIASSAASAVNYLNSMKPKPLSNGGMLDTKTEKVPSYQKAAYDRALDIAQQPLMIFQHIKNGTLLPQDVNTLKTIYPGAYQKMVTDLTSSLTDHLAKGETVPYNQRLGLSLFLGQPVDSTMTPAAMNSIMNSSHAQPAPQVQQQQPKKVNQETIKTMNKNAKAYQTPGQAAAARRSGE